MTQLILIRHGQTQWNQQHRMQGQSDSPLTETGVLQSRLLGQRLARMQFTALYSSDSGRAHHTARVANADTARGAPALERCALILCRV